MHFHEDGKTLFLRGVNLGDAKFPPGAPTYLRESLSRAESCSYVGAPLPLDEAPQHLQKLRFLGFNVVRVPVVWEGLEHAGPGIYDDEYMEYVRRLVELCGQHGFRVIINPHQDLWSRHAGGSGAPLWTLHACGLDPDHFSDTHAALRYSEWPPDREEKDPKDSPPMMWTTNHNRLATCTLFALFFGGRDFAPKCVIDGVNIQDYLQRHYLAAHARLAEKLGDLPFGYDSMNEPEPGYISWQDLGSNERENTPKIHSNPSPVECMRLGMAIPQDVHEFRLGQTGPHKIGAMKIEPKHTCWLKQEDPRWKWERAPSWPLNTCVWALHDVWDMQTGALKRPGHFSSLPNESRAATRRENEADSELSFVSSYWQEFHQQWVHMLRDCSLKTIAFLQPSVFAAPPPREEPRMAYSPHFYDGLTIMRRHWHERWNADVLGLLRGHHKLKALGLRVGRSNVRKVMSSQIGQLAADIKIPTLIGETGIPFNLDGSKAYRDGDYTAHVKALDALISGCDDHLVSFTLWAYCAVNTHEWGDGWNGEDLSIYSAETGSFPNHPLMKGFRAPAAWCRPYVQSVTGPGQLASMKFDVGTGRFEATIEPVAGGTPTTTNASTEQRQPDAGALSEGGEAVIYVPWLHYRATDDDPETVTLDVSASDGGTWSVEGQRLAWRFGPKGGRFEVVRKGGKLSAEQVGTLVKVA